MKHKNTFLILIGLSVAFVLISVLLDQRMLVGVNSANPQQTSDVIIAAIDSNSLERHGPWPWSRPDQARIIEVIASNGARSTIIDLLYNKFNPLSQIQDQRLITTIENAGNVILPFGL